MSLDDQIAKFLADADARPARSKLEPYADLIRQLRQRRWTFRKIADALRERFAVTASPSTIHDFAKVRAQRARAKNQRTQPEHPQPGAAAPASSKPPRFHVRRPFPPYLGVILDESTHRSQLSQKGEGCGRPGRLRSAIGLCRAGEVLPDAFPQLADRQALSGGGGQPGFDFVRRFERFSHLAVVRPGQSVVTTHP